MTPVILFPDWFVEWLITGALWGTGAGALVLLSLFIHDWRRGELW